MDLDFFYEKRLKEVHEVFSSKQVEKFIQQCLIDAKSRFSLKDSVIEKELKIKKGSLKTLPKILSSKENDTDEYIKNERIFYMFIEEYVVDFYDELNKILRFYEENPQELKYNIYYLADEGFRCDPLIISNKTDKIISVDNRLEFELIDNSKFNIPNEYGQLREIKLDRPIDDKLEEVICGEERLIADDRTLIRTTKLVLVQSKVKLEGRQKENIALYLANEQLQRSIYPQDIYSLKQLDNEVVQFRCNNRWFNIVMPKVLIDAYVKYLYHFKSYVKQEKNIDISINFVEEEESIILQIDAKGKVNDYIIGEWLDEYISFLITNQNDLENIKNSNTRNKVKLQRQRFFEDVKLEEKQYNAIFNIQKLLEDMLNEIRSNKESSRNLIIYGGYQQFADTIMNEIKLINKTATNNSGIV